MSVPFNELLVPLDGSQFGERALPLALELADRTGAAVTLLSCAGPGGAEQRASYLAGLIDRYASSATIETVLCDDESPVRAITERSGPGTLVCVSTHGHGRSEALVGSVAEAVLRAIQDPILVVGPHVPAHAWLGSGRIVACIDGSREAAAALEPAARLARALDMPLWLTAVASPDLASAGPSVDLREDALLAAAAQQLGPVVEGWDVLHDIKPARALAGLAEGLPVSLLVLATTSPTGWRRLTSGSITASVVHHAEVPVLIVPTATAAMGTRPVATS